MTDSALSRLASKSPEHALANRLVVEAGLNQAQVRLIVDAVVEHIQQYHSDKRPPGVVVHTAVSKSEPRLTFA